MLCTSECKVKHKSFLNHNFENNECAHRAISHNTPTKYVQYAIRDVCVCSISMTTKTAVGTKTFLSILINNNNKLLQYVLFNKSSMDCSWMLVIIIDIVKVIIFLVLKQLHYESR